MVSQESIQCIEHLAAGKSLHDKRLMLETLESLEAAGFIVALEDRAVIMRDAGEVQDLPAPRLQLRWVENDRDEGYICHYEMVLEVGEYDIRREQKDGEKASRFLAIPLGCTQRSGDREPVVINNTGQEVEQPFRDGAHAKWDASALKLPLFALWGDRATRINVKES